jgi:hypothetical protein
MQYYRCDVCSPGCTITVCNGDNEVDALKHPQSCINKNKLPRAKFVRIREE